MKTYPFQGKNKNDVCTYQLLIELISKETIEEMVARKLKEEVDRRVLFEFRKIAKTKKFDI